MLSNRFLFGPVAVSIAAVLAFSMDGAAEDNMKAVPTRDQIPDQYKWDLSVIYKNAEAWEADFARAGELIASLEKRKGTLGKSAGDLLAVLKLRDDVERIVEKMLVYAHQSSHLDMGNNEALGLKDRASTLAVRLGQAESWIEPELLALPEETLRSWCKSQEGLDLYTHYFDDVIRQKAHTLSAREEELLAMGGKMASAAGSAYSVLNNAELTWTNVHDEEGQEVQLSHARYNKFIRSADRNVRRETFLAQMKTYAILKNTMAALLSGAVERDIYYARARGFENSLEAALFPNAIPPEVFRNLVTTIDENLPYLHRWAALRKKVLKLDELHVYDLYQPIVPGVVKEIEYDDAVDLVVAALPILGDQYCEPMKKGFASRWIDVYESQGKRSGGYSWGAYDTQPFILLNYNKTLREVSTIAHEMGHSMHSYLTRKHQPKIYGDYATFVAEVASTFNEILLQDHMLKNTTDPKERAYLLNHAINQMTGTVFRQTMFAEFELGIHEMAERGEALTAASMGKLYTDTFHKYWGPELVRDEEHDPYWARIPHFYRGYYVYQYATSYCAAAALAKGVLAGEPGAVDRYLAFLKSGSSEYPIDVLRRAGVDMTTPEPIQATMERFDQLVSELAKLLEA